MRALAPVTVVLAAVLGACADPQPATLNPGGGGGACTTCHGDSARAATALNPQLPAAPPVAPAGKPGSVVGAHQGHLNNSAIRSAVACDNCHVVPSDATHAGGGQPVIVFAPGKLATTQNVTPTFDGTALTCSSTYCHGNFKFGTVVGNTAPTPAWTSTAALGCTGCHGLPPTGHPALTGTVTAVTCNQCHPTTVKADGTIDVAGGKHMNGLPEFQGGHSDPLWMDPTHHGFQASAGGLQACTSCHTNFGAASGAAGSSCNTCHGGTAWQTNCLFCHGTAGRTGFLAGADALLAAAPPVGTQGESATTTVAVGAHQGHVNPAAATAVSGPLACTSCHPSPLPADVAHVNGQPTAVQFGGIATTGNVTPVYNRGAAPTCSSTYCHGNFKFGTVVGNTAPTPAWTNAAALGCTGCHGLPPTGHPALTGTVTAVTCNQCHPATVKADGTIDVAGGKHLNGAADVTGGHPAGWSASTVHGYQASAGGLQACTGCHVGFGAASGVASSSCNTCHGGTAWQTNCLFCHGTAGRTGFLAGTDARLAASPPVGTQGETAITQVAVGAHQAHANPPATGALSNPFACTVCHPSPLPADVAHVNGQPTAVQFSGIAGAGTYNRTASPTCSSTYCHGATLTGGTLTTPTWTGGVSQAACGTCHAITPALLGGEHNRSDHRVVCSTCHGSGYSSTTVNGPSHVNGLPITMGTGTPPGWIASSRSCNNGTGCHGGTKGPWR